MDVDAAALLHIKKRRVLYLTHNHTLKCLSMLISPFKLRIFLLTCIKHSNTLLSTHLLTLARGVALKLQM